MPIRYNPCEPCCVPPTGQVCILSAKFAGCMDVTDFTMSLWPGWFPATMPVPTTDPEFTTVLSSLPFCYKVKTTASYGMLIQKTGYLDDKALVGVLPKDYTKNYDLALWPASLTVTDDNGTHTMMPAVESAGNPVTYKYGVCALVTDIVSCIPPGGDSSNCAASTVLGQSAYYLELRSIGAGNHPCGLGFVRFIMTQAWSAGGCGPLDAPEHHFIKSHCDPTQPLGTTQFANDAECQPQGLFNSFSVSPTLYPYATYTNCSPLDLSFAFPYNSNCQTFGDAPIPTSSAQITL